MTKSMERINQILGERRGTHGSFRQNANFSQGAKRSFAQCGGEQQKNITNVQLEAVHNIIQKLSRIAQNPWHRDNWDDIIGYAALALEEIEEHGDNDDE